MGTINYFTVVCGLFIFILPGYPLAQEVEINKDTISTYGANQSRNALIYGAGENFGHLILYNDENRILGTFGAGAVSNAGYVSLSDSTGGFNCYIGPNGSNSRYGWMGVYDDTQTSSRARMAVSTAGGYGWIGTDGQNDSLNVVLSTWGSAYPNNGLVRVYDSNQRLQAFMGVDASGQGIVSADIKNFRTEHPTENDKDIWYASLEGAEAGAYVRGTAMLTKGRGEIVLPDHFKHVAAPQGVTIILTPLSITSKGMAVLEKDISDGVIEVGELLSGTGSYEFDWEVKAVRKGFESYEVVRPKSYLKMGEDMEDVAPLSSGERGN